MNRNTLDSLEFFIGGVPAQIIYWMESGSQPNWLIPLNGVVTIWLGMDLAGDFCDGPVEGPQQIPSLKRRRLANLRTLQRRMSEFEDHLIRVHAVPLG